MSTTVVSAPGKVLLAGGYLILDPKYSGIVVSTSSRFYSVVSPTPTTPGFITVNSPQFTDAVWRYSVGPNDSIDAEYVADGTRSRFIDSPDCGTSPSTTNANKFVHLALENTLTLVTALKGPGVTNVLLNTGLQIHILGHNDFYSQRITVRSMGSAVPW